MIKSLFLISFTFLTYNYLLAQDEKTESRMDFWVGDWACSWTNQDGSLGTGSNKIEKILGGKVILENFKADAPTPDQVYEGKSFSVYQPQAGTWKQTWVDNQSGYLEFDGQLVDGNPAFSRSFTNAEGKEINQRMVFYDIKEESFSWRWESSVDKGESWTTNWLIEYKSNK